MGAEAFDGPLLPVLEGLAKGAHGVTREKLWDRGRLANARRFTPASEQFVRIHQALAARPAGVHLTLTPTGGWARSLGATRDGPSAPVGEAVRTAADASARWIRTQQLLAVPDPRERALHVAVFRHDARPDGVADLHVHLVIPDLQPAEHDSWWEIDRAALIEHHCLGAQAVFDLVLRHSLAYGDLRVDFTLDEAGVAAPKDADSRAARTIVAGGPEHRWLGITDRRLTAGEVTPTSERPSLREVLGPPRPLGQSVPHRPVADVRQRSSAPGLSLDERAFHLNREHADGLLMNVIGEFAFNRAHPAGERDPELAPIARPKDPPTTLAHSLTLGHLRDLERVLDHDQPEVSVLAARETWFDAVHDLVEPRWITAILGIEVQEYARQRLGVATRLRAVGIGGTISGEDRDAAIGYRDFTGQGEDRIDSAPLRAIQEEEARLGQVLRRNRRSSPSAVRARSAENAERFPQQELPVVPPEPGGVGR
jgi:hypothetical protein